MRRLFFFLLLLFPLLVQSQEYRYYDFNWKICDPSEARFYAFIRHTDSGWFRQDFYMAGDKIQMVSLYEDKDFKTHNGYSTWFYPNGQVSATGKYVHNKREGVCLSFHLNGMLSDSAYFHEDEVVGTQLRWYPNGYQKDSIIQKNDSIRVSVSWFDNGTPASAGYYLWDQPQGTWQYFHKSGALTAERVYANGTLIKARYLNEAGETLSDTTHLNSDAEFAKGGTAGWQKYLFKNLYWPSHLKFDNGNTAVVGVRFTINEEGAVEDAYVDVPLHPEFDKIALDVVRRSPAWLPSMKFNRKVKQEVRQAVTFVQEE